VSIPAPNFPGAGVFPQHDLAPFGRGFLFSEAPIPKSKSPRVRERDKPANAMRPARAHFELCGRLGDEVDQAAW